MSPEIAKTLQGFLPLLGLAVGITLIYGTMLMMQRSNNIKRATDHAWVEIWPKVGKYYSYLTPILEGGTVRIQDRNDNEFARYILSKGAATRADWPPGKSNFVQVTLDKVIYREGDAIPMSEAIGDRPSFDCHQLDALVENVATAAAEVTRISMEESKGTSRKQNPFLWIYIMIGAVAVGIIYLIVIQHGANEIITKAGFAIDSIGKALGVQTIPIPPVK